MLQGRGEKYVHDAHDDDPAAASAQMRALVDPATSRAGDYLPYTYGIVIRLITVQSAYFGQNYRNGVAIVPYRTVT